MADSPRIDFRMHNEAWRHRLPTAYREGGHRGRFSDSSHYDDVCVLCGDTDATPGYYQASCMNAVSDDTAQAARDAAPKDVTPVADNSWIENAPGRGRGGLAAGSSPENYRAQEVGDKVEFHPVDPVAESAALAAEAVPPEDPESRLAELSAAASPGRIAVSPFVYSSGDNERADLIIEDPSCSALGFRMLARDVPIADARYIARLWNSDRSKRS